MSLEKFQIQISDKTLEDLAHRLSNTRWPNQLKDTDWERGIKKDELDWPDSLGTRVANKLKVDIRNQVDRSVHTCWTNIS